MSFESGQKLDVAWGQEAGKTPKEEGLKYLLFRVGPFPLALGLEVLKKVYDAEGFPFRTAGSRMLDLHRLTGAEAERGANYWIEMELAQGRYLIPVEEVEGIRELNLAVAMPYPEVLARAETRYVKQIFFDGLRMISLLEAESVVAVSEEKERQKLRARLPRKKTAAVGSEEKTREGEGGNFPPGQGGKQVVFATGKREWMVSLDQVIQIMNVEEIYPFPSAVVGVEGAIYFAERAVPILSPWRLEELLGGDKNGGKGGLSTVILVETGKGLLGLGCERIVKVVENSAVEGKTLSASAPSPPLEVAPSPVPLEQLVQRMLG